MSSSPSFQSVAVLLIATLVAGCSTPTHIEDRIQAAWVEGDDSPAHHTLALPGWAQYVSITGNMTFKGPAFVRIQQADRPFGCTGPFELPEKWHQDQFICGWTMPRSGQDSSIDIEISWTTGASYNLTYVVRAQPPQP